MLLSICSVDSTYITYLKSDPRLFSVYDNKEAIYSHGRKYLGVVLEIKNFNYYVPLSSPKKADFDNAGHIRKSVIPIMRIITPDQNGVLELKATLRFSNMIPVPNCAIIPFNIYTEPDQNYKMLLIKEYNFIRSNQDSIFKNAEILYEQRTKSDTYYIGKYKPPYLNSTLDFKYAENKCDQYIAP
jgi:protein AbiQ